MVGKSVEIFFSYSHKDEDLRDKLASHLAVLKREKIIADWYDRQIVAGTPWADEIDAHLNTADLILLLISADFLNSDYCWGVELNRAMKRHRNEEAWVIPVILRPVDWKGASFGLLQALPKNAKPVTSWSNQDEALMDVAKGIRAAVEKIRQRKTIANSRHGFQQQLAAVHQQAKQSIQSRNWQKALEQLESLQRLQPQYRDTDDLIRYVRGKVLPHESTPLAHHTAIFITIIIIGWLLAGLIGNQNRLDGSDIPQQIATAGALGGLTNGVSINVKLRLMGLTNSPRQLLLNAALWSVCGTLWGFMVGKAVESLSMQQQEGVALLLLTGIAAGVLSLLWQLKQAHLK